jgi:hypothetical protein
LFLKLNVLCADGWSLGSHISPGKHFTVAGNFIVRGCVGMLNNVLIKKLLFDFTGKFIRSIYP